MDQLVRFASYLAGVTTATDQSVSTTQYSNAIEGDQRKGKEG
jgi:hypothetical protein